MKILCATDLQSKTDAAVDRAYQLSAGLGAPLSLVHVVTPLSADGGTLEQRMLSASSRLALRARHSGAAELVARCGRAPAVVGEEARNARLVVIGPHRAGTLVDALQGTFSERLIAGVRCPVLVVRNPVRGPYRRVLLALDGSTATGSVVRAAESLALPEEAPLGVVHAHEPPYEAMMHTVGLGATNVEPYATASRSQAAAMINRELQRHSRHPHRYRVMLVDARPVPAIRRAMREMQPDLLVLGTRGHGRFRRALLGSTAHEALSRTDCDVLVVPEAVASAARAT